MAIKFIGANVGSKKTLLEKLHLDIYSKGTALNLHVIMIKPDIKCTVIRGICDNLGRSSITFYIHRSCL